MTERSKLPAQGDYAVGYGRPPRHSRFKPGQSGNPKGRPKGRKNLSTILEETLYRSVSITENGRKRKVPAIEAMALNLMRKALEGDLRAIEKINKFLPMVQAATAAAQGGAEADPAFDPEHDAELLADFAQMLREAEGAGGGRASKTAREKKNVQQ